MAPEVLCTSVPYGRAVDWWSVGCLLYEMTSGNPPFMAREKAKLLDMYRQHLSLIDLLPEVKEEDVPAAAEPVAEEPASADVAPAAEVPQQPETEAAPAAEVSDASAESGEEPVSEEVSLVDSLWKPDDAFTPEEESELEDETPVSRFGELKFGKDYEVNSAFKRRK